jgi:hypothetical protein
MKTIMSALVVVVSILGMILVTEVPSYSQNTVIYGCIKKSTGQIRIVSAPGQCKSNEALTSWNSQGPQGPPGVPLGVCSDSATNTYLLYTFVTNQNGFDTGISISNTASDPFETVVAPPLFGNCVLWFYGNPKNFNVDAGKIAPGTTYVNNVSSIAPGFQGYMIAECNIPFAHGFAFISDVGARNLAMGYLTVNICDPRIPPQ